jgi:hypothetical protein
MSAHPEYFSEVAQGVPSDLCNRWRELCSQYLPVAAAGDSMWRYSRAPAQGDLEQGWKLHISATVLSACAVLKNIAPMLRGRGVQFKAPFSLVEIKKINCGLYYGYSQVGKFITVYPQTDEDAMNLARQLYELTRHLSAPAVPFDRKFRPDGCIYYRYGAFRPLEIENPDGTRTPALRNPAGQLVPDLRDSAEAKPDWVTDPFSENQRQGKCAPEESPLKTTYRAFQALSQRGKGGVYKALDLSLNPPRLCILKEGRHGGELSWDGRDGAWRVSHEEQVLTSLRASGVDVPRVYSSFLVEGNYYLVTEFIEGESLQEFLRRRQRRLSLAPALRLGAAFSLLLSRIHAAGWTWRDCKPDNVIVTKKGDLRPLDFEGACLVNAPDATPWGTQGYTPPEWRSCVESRVYEDLYALGATLYFLLAGRLPEIASPLPIERLRRNVPTQICRLISELLTADPSRQPRMQTVTRRLLTALPATRN